MDNCGGQNKNYSLYTALSGIVTTKKISADTITLKYIEAVHTFMSADSCHARVEKQMKKKGDVYDFADFVSCVSKAGAPSYMDFGCYEGSQSQAKLKQKDGPLGFQIWALLSSAEAAGSSITKLRTPMKNTEHLIIMQVKHVLGRDTSRWSSTRSSYGSKPCNYLKTALSNEHLTYNKKEIEAAIRAKYTASKRAF